MSPRYGAAIARLNAQVMAAFGFPVVLVTPAGQRLPMFGDWRQEPLLLDDGGHGTVSTYQATLGVDLHSWPSATIRIEADWSGWSVEIPAGQLPPDIRPGTWRVSNVMRPGGGWIDLELTNHIPAP